MATEAGEAAMHTVIADKKEEVAALCRRHGVARLGEFGSAARGADFDPETSDADVLVEFSPAAGPRTLWSEPHGPDSFKQRF